MKKVMMTFVAALMMTGVAVAQDNAKKLAKMESKEMKKEAKMEKKQAKVQGDYIKVDSAKEAKHDAKMVKKTAKKMSSN